MYFCKQCIGANHFAASGWKIIFSEEDLQKSFQIVQIGRKTKYLATTEAQSERHDAHSSQLTAHSSQRKNIILQSFCEKFKFKHEKNCVIPH
jgi:hypothetical protein